MKKIRFFVILALLALPFMQLSAQNRSKQLVLYTWEDWFPREILDGFTKATGIEVVYKTFEYNEDMLMDLQANNAGVYDLVIADDYIIEFAITGGLAQKLNKAKLNDKTLGNGDVKNINPTYQHQFYDPGDEYTVPYGAGVQTIVYDPARINLDIKGYKDLWNPQLRGKLGIVSNYRVVNGRALKELGKSYNTENVGDIKAAGQRLLALVPNIRLVQDLDLDTELLKGNISAAVMYTDQVTKSMMKNPKLKAVYPREGIGFGVMAAFVPRRAPNADAAHKFLNYILDSNRGARCFEYLGYYCTYSASEAQIKPEFRKHLILPKFDNLATGSQRFELIQNLSQEAEDAHGEIWLNFNLALGR